jgi:UDP-glucose 4-epimerase
MRAYNIGLGASYSVREVCKAAAEVTGRTIQLRISARREGDPAVLCASPKRIMQELGWKPQHSSLREIIESAWQWKQKQLSSVIVMSSSSH